MDKISKSSGRAHCSDIIYYRPDTSPLLYLFDGCSVSCPDTNSKEQFLLSVVGVCPPVRWASGDSPNTSPCC
jgi:hypothetical protein